MEHVIELEHPAVLGKVTVRYHVDTSGENVICWKAVTSSGQRLVEGEFCSRTDFKDFVYWQISKLLT